jgi:hypothetical protein
MKGKHSAAAANRRLGATQDHVDRLTEQLVEQKIKARRYEQDALRLPAVERECARLRQQVGEGVSDALLRERARQEKIRAGFIDDLGELYVVFRSILKDIEGHLTTPERVVLDRIFGAGTSWLDEVDRDVRRTKITQRIVNHGIRTMTDDEMAEQGFAHTHGGMHTIVDRSKTVAVQRVEAMQRNRRPQPDVATVRQTQPSGGVSDDPD